MHNERYKVVKPAHFSPPGPMPPTTQITMDVKPDPPGATFPTPVPKVVVMRLSAGSGNGSEIEQLVPPPPPTVAQRAQVNFEPTGFDTLKGKLQDKLCTVFLNYQSQVEPGNDRINSFQPIYVF